MKKSLWILFFLILIIGIAFFAFYNNSKYDNYTAKRTSTQSENSNNENVDNNMSDNSEEKLEEELAEFSTKLPKDTKARDDNIKLACDTLNNTIVESGKTFSLWDVLGCPTKEKGYQKAKTFTSDGEVKQSYGGGICQISTTLYNVVLKVDELKIKERHEHSRDVPYIEDGKDAAVSFDTADFKFENTFEYDIKIEAKVEDNKVKIVLIRI